MQGSWTSLDPLWGLVGQPATMPRWLLLGGEGHSSITSSEHGEHPFLIFSPAPLLSYSQLGGARVEKNAFGCWLIYCYIAFWTFFSRPTGAKVQQPKNLFIRALTEVTGFKKAWKAGTAVCDLGFPFNHFCN